MPRTRVGLVYLGTGLLTGLLLGGVSGPSLAEGAWQRELERANGWTWTTASDQLATDTLLRAAAARGAVGALPATELLVYRTTLDASGDEERDTPAGGAVRRLRFAPGEAPPADAFWTLTVYRADGGLGPASDGPRSIASDELPDGDAELEVLLARESPGDGRAWLAAPRDAYQLVLRLYRPSADALAGRWRPPVVLEARP